MKKKIKKRKREGQMRIMGFGMEKDFVFAGFKGEQSGHCDDKFWVENNSVK